MKRKMALMVRGKQTEWVFNFEGRTEHLRDWLDDGLEVYVVENSIPMWAQQFGLTRPWCAVQDAWQWLRVW